MASWLCGGLAAIVLASTVCAIPIDNGVEGEPEIECGASSIAVTFNTRNNFEGHVYVIGRYNEGGCRNDDGGTKVASIKLPFDNCGTQRQRSLNPRGIFVSTTVVVTFHPQFLTKVDRAYRVQCFYMEADKTVSQDLEVSDITTAFQTQVVPMPVCTYQILEGGPNGQPIKFANIGQQVYHKWNCVTETTDIFCAIIHSCFVDDGAGNRVQLLDQNGCALDRFLLQNLEYSSDLMAGQEAHVFKYADKPALFFQCQISITIKEPNLQCPRPQCAAPGGAGAGGAAIQPGPAVASPSPTYPESTSKPAARPPLAQSPLPSPPAPLASNATFRASRTRTIDFPFRFRRFRRDVASGIDELTEELGVWDVQSQTITALDVGEQTGRRQVPAAGARSHGPEGTLMGVFCLSPHWFFTITFFAVSTAIITTIFILVLWSQKCRKNSRN